MLLRGYTACHWFELLADLAIQYCVEGQRWPKRALAFVVCRLFGSSICRAQLAQVEIVLVSSRGVLCIHRRSISSALKVIFAAVSSIFHAYLLRRTC